MSKMGLTKTLALACVVLLHSAAAAQAPTAAGMVTSLSGKATVARASIVKPVSLRSRDGVFGKDRISVGEDSLLVMLLGGKTTVTARELSVITISDEPRRSRVGLDLGKVAVDVNRSLVAPGETIEVRTPNVVAAVRGTVFVVEVKRVADPAAPGGAGQLATTVSVLEGIVDVAPSLAPGSAPVPVGALETVTVTGASVGTPRPLQPEAARQLLRDVMPRAPQATGPSGSFAMRSDVTWTPNAAGVGAPVTMASPAPSMTDAPATPGQPGWASTRTSGSSAPSGPLFASGSSALVVERLPVLAPSVNRDMSLLSSVAGLHAASLGATAAPNSGAGLGAVTFAVAPVLTGTTGTLTSTVTAATSGFTSVVTGATGTAAGVASQATTVVSGVAGAVTGTVVGISGAVTPVVTGTVAGISGAVTPAVTGAVAGVSGAVGGGLGGVTSAVTGAVSGQGTGSALGGVAGAVTLAVTGAVSGQGTGSALGGVAGAVTGATVGVSSSVTGAATGATGALGGVTGAITGATSGVTTAVAGATGGLTGTTVAPSGVGTGPTPVASGGGGVVSGLLGGGKK